MLSSRLGTNHLVTGESTPAYCCAACRKHIETVVTASTDDKVTETRYELGVRMGSSDTRVAHRCRRQAKSTAPTAAAIYPTALAATKSVSALPRRHLPSPRGSSTAAAPLPGRPRALPRRPVRLDLDTTTDPWFMATARTKVSVFDVNSGHEGPPTFVRLCGKHLIRSIDSTPASLASPYTTAGRIPSSSSAPISAPASPSPSPRVGSATTSADGGEAPAGRGSGSGGWS